MTERIKYIQNPPPPYNPNYGSSPNHEQNLGLHYQPPYQQPYPPPPPTPMASSNVTIVNPPAPTQTIGTCPVCHAGTFETSYSCCGWLTCCIFFPIGILCCYLCCQQKKCNHCGFTCN